MFLKTLLQKIKNERGAIFVLTAVVLPVMLGLAGLGYDVGNLYVHKGRLQHVADAAVLAGARAFVNSGEAADESPERRNLIPYSENMDLPSRSSGVHDNADREADKYIKSNIVNLHNGVSSDEYSHLALQSVGDNAKTYYRVGLSEKVRLHFLPLFPGIDREATVRASAVALAENQPSLLPPLPVSPKENESYSIFDNLFTFSEYMQLDHVNDDSNNKFGFSGRMIYTMLDNNSIKSLNENFYYSMGKQNSSGDEARHIWNTTGKGNSGTAHINDPFVNPLFNTQDYIKTFDNWLMTKDDNKLYYEITDFADNDLTEVYINDRLESNVFYYNYEGDLSININGQINTGKYIDAIDGEIKLGNIYTPVYIIVKNSVTITNLTLTNNLRPVVLVYLGTEQIVLNGGGGVDSNVVIYAPYSEVVFKIISGTYNGNIIARGIRTEGYGNNGKWIMKNFLNNYDEKGNLLYQDKFVEDRRKDIASSITATNNNNDGKNILSSIINILENDSEFSKKNKIKKEDIDYLLLTLGYYKDKWDMQGNLFENWWIDKEFSDEQKRILANAMKEVLYGDDFGNGHGYTGGSGGNSEQPEDPSSAKVRLISDSEIKSSPFKDLKY